MGMIAFWAGHAAMRGAMYTNKKKQNLTSQLKSAKTKQDHEQFLKDFHNALVLDKTKNFNL